MKPFIIGNLLLFYGPVQPIVVSVVCAFIAMYGVL